MPKQDNTGVDDDELDLETEEEEGAEGAADPSGEGKRTVPLKMAVALRRENQDLKTRLARLEGRVDGIGSTQRNTPAPEGPKRPAEYTRAQLDVAVTAGTITETTRDEILARQSEARTAQTIKDATDNVRREVKIESKIENQLQTYIADYPDLTDKNSELRAKVQAAFDELVEFGDDPNNPSTQLKAVKMVVPAVSKAGRRKQPEAHEEGDSGAGSDGEVASKDAGWKKGLTKRHVDYYAEKLTKGVYKGVTDAAFIADVKGSKARLKAAH